jgi:hypothetical protein
VRTVLNATAAITCLTSSREHLSEFHGDYVCGKLVTAFPFHDLKGAFAIVGDAKVKGEKRLRGRCRWKLC